MMGAGMRSLVLVVMCSGCFQFTAEFFCESDGQCGRGGHCETTNFCSFDTNQCASGRKYGDLAPSRLAGQCVGDTGDFAGVDLAGADLAGLAGDDLAGRDFAGADLANGLTLDLSGPHPDGACGYPQLLVTVQNLAAKGVGEVLRFQVPPYPQPLVQCTPLTGSGLIGQSPWAVTPFGTNQIAVASIERISIIDTTSDTVVAYWPSKDQNTLLPIDVAPITHAGDSYVAVAYAPRGQGYMDWLDLYKIGSNTPTDWWRSDIGLSSVVGLTIDTQDPTKLFIADDRFTNPVYEEALDPFVPSTMDRAAGIGGDSLISLASVKTPTGGVSTWVSTIGVHMGSDGPSSSSFFGNFNCGCSGPLHAIAEPEASVNVAFVLCENASINARTVERRRSDSLNPQCSTVLDGATLPGDTRLTHLGYIYP
jgi:hypothetical protein